MRARLTLCLLTAAAFAVMAGCESIRPKESAPDTSQSAENDCMNGKPDRIHLVWPSSTEPGGSGASPSSGGGGPSGAGAPSGSMDRGAAGSGQQAQQIAAPKAPRADPELESILGQTSEPRLASINRSLYLALRSLDDELRREQKLAACRNPFAVGTQSQASSQSQSAAGGATPSVGATANGGGVAGGAMAAGGAAGGGAAGGETGGGGGTAGSGAAAAGGGTAVGGAAVSGTATNPGGGANAGAASAGSVSGARRASLPAGGGGNGATAPKTSPGSDNDVVGRRLRRAAEQETDPVLRAKLWREYWDYRHGTAAK
ncbi:MAG TPA: hypothetical protein VHB68_19110 [Steroidobacteraceae bacterium]|nr:hypothetical protein [Steroidobacteraceae bacterium]